MEIIPAIDLMKGKVVRLVHGDPKTAKIYDCFGEPPEIAEKWKKEGAKSLHIIDLDAALGLGDNLAMIAKIAETADLPIQVGGGIRKLETVEKLFGMGISRVILGALAFREPSAITKIHDRFSLGRVIVALDDKDGKIMVEGWKTSTQISMEEALAKFSSLQVKTFLITSIARDGTLSGPDVKTLEKTCAYPSVSIIAAGGISSLRDLALLKQIGVEGTVIGKALYEGLFTLREALKVAKGGQN
jgi:phosphoribosylformimino-5-aminoimidazole carboxamide ribotide isomerase